MYNPPHPGEIIRELHLKPLGITVTKAAQAIGVSRKAMSDLVNGHAGISPEMAVRLSLAFNTTSDFWLTLQMNYDLWMAKKREKSLRRRVRPLVAA